MKKLILTLLLCLTAISPALAKDKRIIQVEDWLSNLSTGTARFVQKGFDGREATGTFYIHRPGRLRFEYDGQNPDLAVADGWLIHFYDAEQKQSSSAPIGHTLADFLLRPTPKLDGDLQVTNLRSSKGMLSMSISQIQDPAAGQIILHFTQQPLNLKSWEIIDAQGLKTEIILDDFQTGMPLAPALFVFNDPSGRGRTNR